MTTKRLFQYTLICLCIVLIVFLFCMFKYFPPNGILICTMESAPGDTYAEYTYSIDFKLWKATDFVSEEKIVSNDQALLSSYEKEQKQHNSNYYKNEITVNKNEIITKTTINYKELAKARKDNSLNLRIGSIKKGYTSIGATCKYK